MKLITYTTGNEPRLGAVRGDQVIDLAAASDGKLPSTMIAFLEQGEPAMTLARELLAGYGKPVELEVLHSNSKRGRDIGEITQQLFKDVGVTANPAGLDFGPVIKKVISGKYQVSTWRISSRPDQGPALFLTLHSKSRANFSRYKNPEMDQLLVAQRMETDPKRRNEILCQIARLINDDVPILYRGGMRGHIITKANVNGISSIKDGIVRLETVSLSQ